MRKIPTLFKRVFENHKIKEVLPEVEPGLEWVLEGDGVATEKHDGSCCAIINGELYKRYDAKNGKPIPEGAIKCQEAPDPITGHFPCWVKCNRDNPADKWFWVAEDEVSYIATQLVPERTYEAIGRHFNGNPYNMVYDMLIPHGMVKIEVERTYEGIKEYLRTHEIEGIVFWKDDKPQCKIKRTDFGFEWPLKRR